MEDNFNDIDQLLFSQLSDASVDEPGIDWNAFNKKRKKRRLVFWFFSFAGLFFILGISFLLFNIFGDKKISTPQSTLSSATDTKQDRISNTDTLTSSAPILNYANERDAGTKTKVLEPISTSSPSPKTVEQNGAALPLETQKETNAEITASPFEITMASKKLFGMFHFLSPVYTAQKVPQNTATYPVLSVKDLKLYWEIQVGPSLNIPNFKVLSAGKDFIHKDYEGIRKVSETAESGYNFQVAIGKTLKRWSYGIGFGVSSFNIKGNYNFNYSEKPVIDVDGRIENYLQSGSVNNIQFTSKQKLAFIEVPINVQYLLIDKEKFGAGVRLGYFNQFLSSIHGQLPNAVFLDERENMTTENFKIRTSALQAGLQLHYKINKESGLILMPEYRKGMGFSQVQSYYKTNYSYWGLNLTYRKAL